MGLFDSLFSEKKKFVPATPEENLAAIQADIAAARTELKKIQSDITSAIENKKAEIQRQINGAQHELADIERSIASRKAELVELDEKILLQHFALYEPTYNFINSAEYKAALEQIRERQKEMLKNGTAASGNLNWTVNGSAVQGRKMVNDTQKLLLRAFNGECEYVTWKVKYNNFDSCRKRIENSYEAIQKLGRTMDIRISAEYLRLKIEELRLALEYQLMKEREHEAQRELRERQREEAALRKEMEEVRRKIEKEQAHFEKALETARHQLAVANESDRNAIQIKVAELEQQAAAIQKNLETLDYREANQKAGYVYIISNIGAFGENIYKIGMTRRLEPQERIDELSGASVPFKFDVHAMIFTEDAPKLEAALHKAFETRKLNLVNPRREFFKVTLEEIEAVVKANFDKSVDFIRVADATQFRESEKLREKFMPPAVDSD